MTNNTQRSVDEITEEICSACVEFKTTHDGLQFWRFRIKKALYDERQAAEEIQKELNCAKTSGYWSIGKITRSLKLLPGDPIWKIDEAIEKLRQENEALKAQVSGLVGALDEVGKYLAFIAKDAPQPDKKLLDAILAHAESISTLPSTFLEIQKAKDACVETLKRIKENASSTMSFEMIECEAEEAVRTLQQAQEKNV